MPTGNINRMSTNFNEARPASQGGRDPSPSILKIKGGGDGGSKVTRKSSGVQWNLKDSYPMKLNRYLSGASNRRIKTSMLRPKILNVEPYQDQNLQINPPDTKEIDLFAYKTIDNLENSYAAIKNEDLEYKE